MQTLVIWTEHKLIANRDEVEQCMAALFDIIPDNCQSFLPHSFFPLEKNKYDPSHPTGRNETFFNINIFSIFPTFWFRKKSFTPLILWGRIKDPFTFFVKAKRTMWPPFSHAKVLSYFCHKSLTTSKPLPWTIYRVLSLHRPYTSLYQISSWCWHDLFVTVWRKMRLHPRWLTHFIT